MATEFRLTLAGTAHAEDVAQRAMPGVVFTPGSRTFGADTTDQLGVSVVVRAGTDGYVEAVGDAGTWVWEPTTFTAATFRMTKAPDAWEQGLRNMLAAVTRVLGTGREDAALVLNGDDLLLTRLDGALVKHRRADWWDRYTWSHAVMPG
jgi:hypothetical protein